MPFSQTEINEIMLCRHGGMESEAMQRKCFCDRK